MTSAAPAPFFATAVVPVPNFIPLGTVEGHQGSRADATDDRLGGIQVARVGDEVAEVLLVEEVTLRRDQVDEPEPEAADRLGLQVHRVLVRQDQPTLRGQVESHAGPSSGS